MLLALLLLISHKLLGQNPIEPGYQYYDAANNSIEIDGDISDWANVQSNVEQWELANGVLAEFELDVKEGASLAEASLSLSEVELTPSGYDNRMLPDVELAIEEKPKAESPQITNVSPDPLKFRFQSLKGKSYEIQASDDLMKWNMVQTIEGTGGEVEFTDLREALFKRQYYRVKVIE